MPGLQEKAGLAPAVTETGGGSGLVYRSRRSILDKEATWRLGEDALEQVADGEVVQSIGYADIIEVRLSYDPTRFESSRYRSDIRARDGSRLMIVSVSYVSPANFDSRAETYVPFVKDLVARVAAANPACRFVSGRPLARYVGSHVFLLAMLLLLVSVLYATGVPALGVVSLKLGLIAIYVPMMIRYTRINWPRAFDPRAIPERALPKP